jgi:hypothetical protein
MDTSNKKRKFMEREPENAAQEALQSVNKELQSSGLDKAVGNWIPNQRKAMEVLKQVSASFPDFDFEEYETSISNLQSALGRSVGVSSLKEQVALEVINSERPSRVREQPLKRRRYDGLSELKCDLCERVFDNKTNRIVHQQQCSGDSELPYLCSTCGGKFKNRDGLKKHKAAQGHREK